MSSPMPIKMEKTDTSSSSSSSSSSDIPLNKKRVYLKKTSSGEYLVDESSSSLKKVSKASLQDAKRLCKRQNVTSFSQLTISFQDLKDIREAEKRLEMREREEAKEKAKEKAKENAMKEEKKSAAKRAKNRAVKRARAEERAEEEDEENDDTKDYVIDGLLGRRKDKYGKDEYLVSWEGYGSSSNSWEPTKSFNKVLLENYNGFMESKETIARQQLRIKELEKELLERFVDVEARIEIQRNEIQIQRNDIQQLKTTAQELKTKLKI